MSLGYFGFPREIFLTNLYQQRVWRPVHTAIHNIASMQARQLIPTQDTHHLCIDMPPCIEPLFQQLSNYHQEKNSCFLQRANSRGKNVFSNSYKMVSQSVVGEPNIEESRSLNKMKQLRKWFSYEEVLIITFILKEKDDPVSKVIGVANQGHFS